MPLVGYTPFFTVARNRRLSALLVLGGRHARAPLEIGAEKRLVGKVEVIGYLLNTHRGIFQQVLGFENDTLVNPLGRRPSAYLLDNRRQVLRGNMQQ